MEARSPPKIVRTKSMPPIRVLQPTDPEAKPKNWTDYEEQYRVLFDPLKPDVEACIMGIPPPPWLDNLLKEDPPLVVHAQQPPASSDQSAPDTAPSLHLSA